MGQKKSTWDRINDGCVAVGMVVLGVFLAAYGLFILTQGN